MHTVKDSGKADYYGDGPHPFFRRIIDRLPAAKLLLIGEIAGQHALYATEAGWQVHAVGFKPEDEAQTLSLAQEKDIDIVFTQYQQGQPICKGEKFDVVVMMFVHLPDPERKSFHQELIRCLEPDGNLYLLAYSNKQPAGTLARLPQIRYSKAELMEDFRSLQIDLLQEEEEELPDSDEKVSLLHLTAVNVNKADNSKDSVSFSW